MTTCPKCGMAYVEGLPEDEKQHKPYHDRVVNGVLAPPLKTDQMIWQEADHRITVITAHSPISQRNRAEAAASMANLETRYNGGIYHAAEMPDKRDIHLFLYHARNRIIGLVILEKRSTVWRCRWRDDQTPHCEELPGHEPMWSVAFIWVHAKHRKKGIAQNLFAQAITHLRLSLDAVGWYSPFTDSGRAFVRKVCPIQFHVAK